MNPEPARQTDPDLADEEVCAPLFARLDQLGIATTTIRHAPFFTVEEGREVRDAIGGGHTKNLLVKDKKGRLFLIVAEDTRVVDLKTLHTRIGARGRLSFVGPEAMRQVLGVAPGSVTAFAVMNDVEGRVTLVLDEGLLEHDIVNCHPMTNRATTSIATRDLLTFLRACGHDPLVARLDEPTENGPVS